MLWKFLLNVKQGRIYLGLSGRWVFVGSRILDFSGWGIGKFIFHPPLSQKMDRHSIPWTTPSFSQQILKNVVSAKVDLFYLALPSSLHSFQVLFFTC
jgi:hypothetical protein